MADFLIALTDFHRFAREERFQADVVPDAACAKHCVDRGSYGSYHRLMRSVGVKALKNNLSRYLDLVRQGEVVLVTDRDEVVAELRLPSQPFIARASPWMAFMEE